MKIKKVKDINLKIREIILQDEQIDRLIRSYNNYTCSCSSGFKRMLILETYSFKKFERIWNDYILPNIKPSGREKLPEEAVQQLNELVFGNLEIQELINEQNMCSSLCVEPKL